MTRRPFFASRRRPALRPKRTEYSRAVGMRGTAAWHEHERARGVLARRERAMASSVAAYDQVVARYRGGEATTTDVVEAEGGKVARVVCLVDRGEGAADAFAARGLTLEALFTRDDLPL